MLPFFGPANVRATAGRFTQAVTTNLTRLIDDDPTRWGVNILGIISIRADLLSATRVFDQAALDPYLFLRDAWVRQNRNATFGDFEKSPDGDTQSPDDFDELDEFDDLDELDDLDERPMCSTSSMNLTSLMNSTNSTVLSSYNTLPE